MGSGVHGPTNLDGLVGTGLTIGMVRARRHGDIVARLADGVARGLAELEVTRTVEVAVPGSLEIPLAAQYLISSGQVDAVVCIGVIIHGETAGYEAVVDGCGRGVQQVQLATGVPVLFGVLTAENEHQALAHSEGPGGHNVGEQAARGAVEMARLAQKWAPYRERT